MPSLALIVRGAAVVQRAGTPEEVRFPNGVLPLAAPLVSPPLSRLRHLRLICNFRVPPVAGVREAILDTGAPFTLVPRYLWRDEFRWKEGRDFEVCDIAGVGPYLDAMLLADDYRCRVVRLKVPVEIAGSVPAAPRLIVQNLVAQLPESDSPKRMIFGLWGGVFTGCRLAVEASPTPEDLAARLEW
jgi:hypothetical protein